MSHWSHLLWKSFVYLVASVRWDAAMWVTAVSMPEDLSGRPEAALFLPFFSPEVAWLVSDSDVMTWKVVAMENGPSKTCLCCLFLMRGSLSSWQASGEEVKTGTRSFVNIGIHVRSSVCSLLPFLLPHRGLFVCVWIPRRNSVPNSKETSAGSQVGPEFSFMADHCIFQQSCKVSLCH